MSVLDKIANAATGGLATTIIDTVKAYFPPSLTESEKAAIELSISNAAYQHEIKMAEQANIERAEFNRRLEAHEGTAKDLKSIPYFGSLLLFLRGGQRVVWGYATLYIDIMWFAGKFEGLTEVQESALWVINLLVLGFLFGERAIQNVAPVVERMLKARIGNAR